MFEIGSWLADPSLIALLIGGTVIFIALTVIWGVKAHRQKVLAGREDLVGKVAEAKTVIDPKGIVFVEGERWTAISEMGRVKPGEEVLVTKVDGLKLYVSRKQDKEV